VRLTEEVEDGVGHSDTCDTALQPSVESSNSLRFQNLHGRFQSRLPRASPARTLAHLGDGIEPRPTLTALDFLARTADLVLRTMSGLMQIMELVTLSRWRTSNSRLTMSASIGIELLHQLPWVEDVG
jgi:hypothetical protein